MSQNKKALTLSIIIPVYNDARHLRDCLESIKNQVEQADEVVVVDNNSTDDSVKIAKKYKFVRLIHEPKQGVLHARNKGFDVANSDIIGRIDSDTVLPKDWVRHVKEYYADAEHREDALTGSGYFYNVPFPYLHRALLGQIMIRLNRFLLGHYIVWGSNMALPASSWRVVRKDVCMRNDIHEDLDLAIHLHRHAFQITYHSQLRVGVVMRRVFSDFGALRKRLLMWPETLKAHHNPKWVFGWLGAYILYGLSPILVLSNWLRKIIGRY